MEHYTVVVLAAVCIGVITAQSCTEPYGGYLNCLKGKLDANYSTFEREFGEDYKRLAFSCFTQNAADANSGKACFMQSESVLDNAFNKEGALAQCAFCQKIASQVRKMIVEAPESTMKCVRNHLSEAIGKEMEVCIRKTQANFRMPPLPDFDAGSVNAREQMINNAGIFIMTDFSLDRCERVSAQRQSGSRALRTKRSSFSNTQQCIDNRKVNGRPIWAQHCEASKQCRASSVSANCQSQFLSTEKATCGCMEEGRQKIQNIINEVGTEIIQLAAATSVSADSCAASDVANDVLRLQKWKECRCKALAERVISENSKQVDLRKLYAKVIDCTDIDAETRDLVQLDNLVKVGCQRLARGGTAGEKNAFDLASAIKFISQLVDALSARLTRFCPGTHCQ